MNNLRQRLKLETADVHQQLHHLPVSKKLLSGRISIADYVQYLEAHRYFYQTMAHHFYHDKSGLIANSTCFVDWLDSDLNKMGYKATTRRDHSHVYDDFSPAVDRSLASELGYAYVKYGSMFGASVILNVLQKKIINRDREMQEFDIPSTYYLSNAVAKQRLFWERFESALCEYVYHEEDGDRVVQSAIKSFEMMYNLLNEGADYAAAKSQLDGALDLTESFS